MRFAAIVVVTAVACGHGRVESHPSVSPGSARAHQTMSAATPGQAPGELLLQAENALAEEREARAVALFGRYLALGSSDPAGLRRAYLGLGRAHEALRDCAAATRAYDGFLQRFPDDERSAAVYARRGACEADIGQWERSAESYRRAREHDDVLPSACVEALAREGYALFMLDRFDQADRALAEADRVFDDAQERGGERFASYYFVGMARFYRAAILHRRFRDTPIRPSDAMAGDYQRKLALLVEAQDAYNHTIKAKHMFWVAASGYQLGSLFEEFYDAIMHAPVPTWLDARQRQIYYEELKKQLRPVVDKAIWVFEKNLATARRLGYQHPFIEQTEAKLNALQAILLAGDTNFGHPHPRFAPEALPDVAPPESSPDGEAIPAVDRKLFVPSMTSL